MSVQTAAQASYIVAALLFILALAGLSRYPQLAHRFEEDADGAQRIVALDGVNLSFAVQTDRGLVVPAVRARSVGGLVRREPSDESAQHADAQPRRAVCECVVHKLLGLA